MDRRGLTCPRRKRNPRASAPDVWAQIPSGGSMIGQNTRANNSRKRKLEGLPDSVASPSIQGGCKQSQRQQQVESVDTSDRSKASAIPQKHVLELILDTLQRKDTYDIFAEPVDPNEVEDYYEIIKEPMDFGTMRAKLHEGMYQNLEQFKHDVFLITKNAMHFNSSATIYFRQARAIHELAKRVFHLLETDHSKFELTFLGSRRKSSSTKKARNDTGGGSINSTNILLDDRTGCSASKSTLMPPPEINKNLQSGLNNSHDAHARVSFRDSNPFSVNLDGKKIDHSKIESNRRSTYDRNQSHFFQVDSNPFAVNTFKPLGDVSYKESLLLFVKGLGPKAKMVAARKLQSGLPDIPGGPRGASPGLFLRPDFLPKITPPPPPQPTSEMSVGVLHCPKATEENVRPVILALEHSHGNHVLESGKTRSKRNCLQTTTSFSQNRSSSDRSLCQSHSLMQKKPRSPQPPLPLPAPATAAAPCFTFDMCFLKAKLDRIIVEVSSAGQRVDNKFGSGFLSWAGVTHFWRTGGSYNSRTTGPPQKKCTTFILGTNRSHLIYLVILNYASEIHSPPEVLHFMYFYRLI